MTIGILAALDRELEAFKEQEKELNARGFVLKTCGVGKVNAAIAACELIHQCRVKRIIVVGTCASLHTHLRQGRMMLATQATYHDMDVSALGFDVGEIPYASQSAWNPDADLTHALSLALTNAGDQPWMGRLLTGDRFIASKDEARKLAETLGGSALDMETAAVAHACAQLNVHWAAVRIVSDNADEYAPTDFETFIRVASQRLVAVILELRLNGPSTYTKGTGI
jgi:adenosylhomocysteine nucleosidase